LVNHSFGHKSETKEGDYALTTVEEAEIVQSFTAMLMKRLTNEIEENFLRSM